LQSVPRDSSELERNVAIFLRSFFFLLLCYIALHKIFPFDLLGVRVAEMTGGGLLLLFLRTGVAAVVAAYFAAKAFSLPPAAQQTRVFCELWAASGLVTMSLIGYSTLAHRVEGEGFVGTAARLLGRGILWLIY
jgi:hypothetical protein